MSWKTTREVAWAICLGAVVMMSCTDDTVPGVTPGACSFDSDCEGSGECVEGECVLVDDEDAGEDVDEMPEPEDIGVEEEEIVEMPGVGDPCDDGDDCPSGFCIEVSEGEGQRVCTDFCSPNDAGSCPEGFVCAAVTNSGADRVFLCFPEAEFLCDTCEGDNDCGGLSDLCLEYPDGRFCGRGCEVRACPEGYDCVEVDGPEGPIDQCRRQTNFCSACFDPDDDGYGAGDECLGEDCDEGDPNRHPNADELCNGADDDCDDLIDEAFDLASDPENCGACGEVCRFEGAGALCVDSLCALGPCLENRHDIDEDPENGCEYFCEVVGDGAELCNGADEDCDGQDDEGFDLQGDPLNCGRCGRTCEFENAEAGCEGGECVLGACDELHYDINDNPEDGCEYLCLTTNEGVEACDNIDNDCDGGIDEGIDTESDLGNCGRCGNVCQGPERRLLACEEGECEVGECEEGFFDIDGRDNNGCEYACAPQNGGREVCNGTDDDCDGDIDEGVLNACGQCGAVPSEVCDGVDNDCNGVIDDGRVCGAYVQSRCRLFVGWADERRGPNGASTTWETCPSGDRDNSGDVRCIGTRRAGRFNRLQLPGDVNSDDEVAMALLCDDNNNRSLASYIETHCALYLGHADNRQGVDRSPTWGDCPPASSGDNGRLRCTSTGFDRRFRAIELDGDVNGDDHLGIAWICRDDADPQRAAALQGAVNVFLGWADRNEGPADNSASWGPCPGQPSGESNGRRCVSTQGDGLYHLMTLGGDVNDDDQLGWALRAR